MTNSALQKNPPNADIDITSHSSDFLWAWFGIFAVCMFAMIGVTFIRPRGQRVFHHIATAILVVTTIAYFSMASDLGDTPVLAEYRGGPGNTKTRAVWFVRYIMWTFNFPLSVLMLLLGTGVALSDTFMTIFMTIVYVVALLCGALVQSSFKWGYYGFALVALFWLWYQILFQLPRFAGHFGDHVRSAYWKGAVLLCSIWTLYPLCWAFSEGSNLITPTGEMVFYGVLDLFEVPVFLFFFTWTLSKIDYETWGFQSGRGGVSSTDPEKSGFRNNFAGGSARPSNVETVTGGAPQTHA